MSHHRKSGGFFIATTPVTIHPSNPERDASYAAKNEMAPTMWNDHAIGGQGVFEESRNMDYSYGNNHRVLLPSAGNLLGGMGGHVATGIVQVEAIRPGVTLALVKHAPEIVAGAAQTTWGAAKVGWGVTKWVAGKAADFSATHLAGRIRLAAADGYVWETDEQGNEWRYKPSWATRHQPAFVEATAAGAAAARPTAPQRVEVPLPTQEEHNLL